MEAREQALISALQAREVRAPFAFAEFTLRAERAQRRARVERGLAVTSLAMVLFLGVGLLAGSAWKKPATAVEPNGPPQAADRSQRLDAELLLASMPAEPAVVRFDTHVAVLDLEDRIALLDDTLSVAAVTRDFHPDLMQLRSERVRLVGTLVQVRYAEQLASASY